MGSSKRENDYSKGKKDRFIGEANLNTYLMKYEMGIKPFHDFTKLMKPTEKFHSNTEKNRMSKVGFTKAMGMDAILYDWNNMSRFVPVYIRFLGDFGVYIKLPTEYITKPEEFLHLVKHYWFIFIKRDISGVQNLYANILTVEEMITTYSWKMATSEGNKNRLMIDMNPGTFKFNHPDAQDIFGVSFMKSLLVKFINQTRV